MKIQEIKFKDKSSHYSILIGGNTINLLPNKIKKICPRSRKIALIYDRNIPIKFIKILAKKLKNFDTTFFPFTANEKTKSLHSINLYLNKLLSKNYNRNDLIISVGGGITCDVVGFIASIYKRGINFINIPTTLLAQVDSAIGGKTGVNSSHGKNLIGAFYQPRLVISDTNFLISLSKKEMVCGYAEILKHAIIKDKNFFKLIKKNTKNILSKKINSIIPAIKKSCEIKMHFVKKDVKEKNIRMILNFGHTFAHAIEVKNNFSKILTHGEAVLAGIILATRLSVFLKICDIKVLKEIEKIYKENSLEYTYRKFSRVETILNLLPFIKNDKKNIDDKINFVLLKKIGKTTRPNSFKISIKNLKRYCKFISQY